MSGTGAPATIVEKRMTLTRAEFAASLAPLLPADAGRVDEAARIALPSGAVEVRFAALEPMRLGGALDLPQARVTLSFENAPQAEREAFLRRFDRAFQRGGG